MAAQALVADRGLDAGMDEIARAAGVAVGTLYRHFATKRDLVSAALEDHLDSIAAHVEAAASAAEQQGHADLMIRDLILGNAAADARLRVLKEASSVLGDGGHGSPSAGRLTAAIDSLLAAGRRTGHVREGVSASDVYLLLSSAPASEAEERRRRWVDLMLSGILFRC